MDGSESDKLSAEQSSLPENVTEQMKILLYNCFQSQQKVSSQKAEITKLKERLSCMESTVANYRSLQERITKLNHSVFESMIIDKKLRSSCQIDDVKNGKSSIHCESKAMLASSNDDISYLNKSADDNRESNYKNKLLNTSPGIRKQQSPWQCPLRRSLSLSSIGTVNIYDTCTKEIKATSCKDAGQSKITSSLSPLNLFFCQVGVEKHTGCKSGGKLNGKGSNSSQSNNGVSAGQGQIQIDNDSGNISGQTIELNSENSEDFTSGSDFDSSRDCGHQKNPLPFRFREEVTHFTIDSCQNIEIKQQDQNEFSLPNQQVFEDKLISHNNEQSKNYASDSAYGASGLSVDDVKGRSNDSKPAKEKEKGTCDGEMPIINLASTFKAAEDIPVSSLDHLLYFNDLAGIDSSILDNCRSSKEIEIKNSDNQRTNDIRTDQQSEHDLPSSMTRSDATADNVGSATSKAADNINSSFPLNLGLFGQMISQTNQVKNQILLPTSQIISKTKFDKLARELMKLKDDYAELQREYFAIYMQMENIRRQPNDCYDGEEIAQMNIDLQEESKVVQMQFADSDHESTSSFFLPTAESFRRERQEQKQAAQMQLSIPSPFTPRCELEEKDDISEIKAAQEQYKMDLEKKIESLHSTLAVEKERNDKLSEMIKNERRRHDRELNHWKERAKSKEKTKGEGSKSTDSNKSRSSNSHSKTTKNNNTFIHMIPPSSSSKADTFLYNHQGARPKQK